MRDKPATDIRLHLSAALITVRRLWRTFGDPRHSLASRKRRTGTRSPESTVSHPPPGTSSRAALWFRTVSPVLATGALTMALATPAHATFPGSTGELVWHDPQFTGQHLIKVGDPFDPKDAPDTITTGALPKWSPDGTQIAFHDNVPPSATAIFVVNADGSGRRQITSPGSQMADHHPSWSRNGEQLVFSRLQAFEGGESQLRIVGVEGGGDGRVVLSTSVSGDDFRYPEWSPDGTNIAVTHHHGDPDVDDEFLLVTPSGGKRQLGTPPSDHSWSPDGSRLAMSVRESNRITLLDPSGSATGSLTVSGAEDVAAVSFTPDGSRLLARTCVLADCEWTLLRVPDSELFFDPAEPQQQTLPGVGPATSGLPVDWQPADHPIVFLHGMLGSTMKCGSRTLWPTFLPFNSGDLLNLRLDASGTANHNDTCGAAPEELLRKVLFADIYDSAIEGLEELAPDRVHTLVWDWRRSPRLQLGKLDQLIDRALEDDLSKKQNLDEVVLVGHSFGGLFIRAALDDPDLAERIRRALTIGTPYWGAPKSIFPLCCGVETPLGSGLDALMLRNDELKELSKTNTGNFWLYPSDAYGRWLSGDDGTAFDQAGVVDYVEGLGGARAVFERARDAHDDLDGFKKLAPPGLREVRAVVGTGAPTIGAVRLIRSQAHARLAFVSGDGTVPAISGAQGPIASTDPLGDDVPISYVCEIGHVELAGDESIMDAFGDYIRWGRPPKKTSGCSMRGAAISIRRVDIGPSLRAARSAADAPPLSETALEALRRGEANGFDVIELSEETIVVADANRSPSVTLPAENVLVTVTPFDESGPGTAIEYGPLSGTLELGASADGRPMVKLNGSELPYPAPCQPYPQCTAPPPCQPFPECTAPPPSASGPGPAPPASGPGPVEPGRLGPGTSWPVADQVRDVTSPALRVTLAPRQRLARVLAKGLVVFVRCSERCSLNGLASLDRRLSRRLRIVAVVARGTAYGGPGRVRLTLRFKRATARKLRAFKRVKLTLKISGADAVGNTRRIKRAIDIRG